MKKQTLITYGVLILLAVVITLLVCGLNGVLTTQMPTQQVVRFVCDGFFVSAVFVFGVGGLSWASKEGAFDGFGYTASYWVHSFFHNKRDWKKKETYAEYKDRKAEKKKGKTFSHMFIVGGVYLLVAVVLFLIYHYGF